MTRGVGHQQDVIWGVPVMGGYEQRHEFVEEHLGGLVVGEKGILVEEVEITLFWVRQPTLERRSFGGVEQEKCVEPVFDWVVGGVSDRVLHGYFLENSGISSSLVSIVLNQLILIPQLLNQLQRQRPPSAFIPIHRGRHKNRVVANQLSHNRQRNRSSLVDNQQFRLRQQLVIIRLYVLDNLPMGLVDVDPDDRVLELLVPALDDLVIGVLLKPKGVQS